MLIHMLMLFLCVFFLEDTTLLFSLRNFKVFEKVVNSGLRRLSEWLIVNNLSLNIKKYNSEPKEA